MIDEKAGEDEDDEENQQQQQQHQQQPTQPTEEEDEDEEKEKVDKTEEIVPKIESQQLPQQKLEEYVDGREKLVEKPVPKEEIKAERDENTPGKIPSMKVEDLKPTPLVIKEEKPIEQSIHINIPAQTRVNPATNEKQTSNIMTSSAMTSIHVVRSSANLPVSTGRDDVMKTIPVTPTPSIVIVKSEEERQRQGSSKIIIHDEHGSSLNELFPPAQQFHQQYGSALSNIQTTQNNINQGVTEAFNKHLPPSPANNLPPSVSTSSPLVIARHENPNTNIVAAVNQLPVSKAILSAKPSLEIKPNSYDLMNNQVKGMGYSQDLFAKPAAQPTVPLSEIRPSTKVDDDVDCSDEEASVIPDTILTSVHHLFPQWDRSADTIDSKLAGKPASVLTTQSFAAAAATAAASAFAAGIRPPQQGQKGFENALLFKDLASKVSSEAANISMFSGKFSNNLVIDQKTISPQLLRSLSADPKAQPSLGLVSAAVGGERSGGDLKTGVLNINQSGEDQAKTSLLRQRLLSQDPGGILNPNVNSKQYPPVPVVPNNIKTPNVNSAFQASRPLQQKIDIPLSSNHSDFRLSSDKLSVTTSLTLSTSRMPEKSKIGLPVPSGLRINPPPEERQASAITSTTWAPPSRDGALKDALLTSKDSQYRTPPLSKSISMTEMPIFATSSVGITSSTTPDNRQKMLLKRTTSNIPIAPAPSITTTNHTDPKVTGSMEYTGAETGELWERL